MMHCPVHSLQIGSCPGTSRLCPWSLVSSLRARDDRRNIYAADIMVLVQRIHPISGRNFERPCRLIAVYTLELASQSHEVYVEA